MADRKTYGGYRRVILIPPAPGRNLLSPIDGDKSLAPEWVRYQSDHKTYGTSLKWQFHENWSNKLSYRYSSNYRDPAVPQMVAQPNGNYTSTLIYFNNRFKTHHIEDVISGSFRTGAIEHDIAIGYSQSRTISTNSIGLGVATIALPDASGNLANPVTDIPRPVGHRDKGDATFNEISSTKRKDLFISDTLHFGNKWDLILGIRRSSLKEKHADYDSSENTPTYALVYRPVDWMSLYGSYIESLEQGGIAAATSVNASEVFPPKVSKQYEVGMKIDRDDWSASLALFQLEKAELYTDPVSQITTQNGEVNYQGVEASVKAMVTPVWMLGASAMLVDAENETVSNPEWEGESPVNIAETELRLFSEYRIAGSGLTFTGGASYTGERPYDGANEYHLDSVSLFDMGARYETSLNGQPLTIRLNIENLTDEAYWLASSGGVLQGPPRTVKLGAQIQF